MSNRSRIACALTAFVVSSVGLTACGGGGTAGPSAVVAQVGSNVITRGTLSHWMASMAGGDYYENIGTKAPVGLVSDPPRYTTCVSAIERLSPAKPGEAGRRGQLEQKCTQLHQALKEQALSFLISVLWSVEEGAEQGLKVTDEEVKQKFDQLKAKQFPTPSALATFLANHEWALSDELYQLKRNMLISKLLPKLEQQLGGPGGKQAFVTAVQENVKKMTAKTDCRPTYVVPNCRQYKAPSVAGPSPDILLEQIAAGH